MTGSVNSLTGGHDISAAFASLPAVKPHVTPEQAFQDHLSDQYGIKAQNYNAGAMVLHAENFAAHHGGGGHDVVKQLTDLVASLRAEINEMKHGTSGAAHEPGHSKIAEQTKLANAKADMEKAQAKDDYDTYIANKVAMKIAKKSADDILEMWG